MRAEEGGTEGGMVGQAADGVDAFVFTGPINTSLVFSSPASSLPSSSSSSCCCCC